MHEFSAFSLGNTSSGFTHVSSCPLQRWGDAPVHSIGAALFARKDQIHFFNDIGMSRPLQAFLLALFLSLRRLFAHFQAIDTIHSNIVHKVTLMHRENVGVTRQTTSITSGTPASDVTIISSSLAVPSSFRLLCTLPHILNRQLSLYITGASTVHQRNTVRILWDGGDGEKAYRLESGLDLVLVCGNLL